MFKWREFADWVATQSGPYDYVSNDRCALGQFLIARGYTQDGDHAVGGWTFDVHDVVYAIPEDIIDALGKSRAQNFESLYARLIGPCARLLDETVEVLTYGR